ncbi:hypothetical protein AAFF_G00358380 [Aldrovandia affinis]|uniref:NACHT domain-containing protein n=1 Tax=Aldrovandia affinis TaxID=143900 RepID=A0AAD7X183_9TELE|nr:hypothetical protein AAFF_G00358380 [Aldrovandia affinis]
MMWTKDSVSAKKKENENSGVIFPPVPKGYSNSPQDLNNKKQPTFQRLQELFFAPSLAGPKQDAYQLLDSRVTNKDKALEDLLNVGGQVNLLDCPPEFLRSLTVLGDEAAERDHSGREETGFAQVVSSRTEGPSDGLHKRPPLDSASCSNRVNACVGGGPHSHGCTIRDIIRGNVTLPCCARKKRFMIYICGGYKDTVAERTALMEEAYPQLYLFCKQRGHDLRMVDLRQGVEDPVTDRNEAVVLHVETLQECQETQGPNFFLFTGQKHEVQTLPLSISTEEFEAILGAVNKERQTLSKRRHMNIEEMGLESQSSIAVSDTASFASEPEQSQWDSAESSALLSVSTVSQMSLADDEEANVSPVGTRTWADADKDMSLLQMCYKLDENRVPPVYILLPVSTHYPDMLSKDGIRRRQARRAWQVTCVCLWGVLQRSSPGVLGEEKTSCLLRTVLESEVEQGLRTNGPPEGHCHWYKRTITDMKYNMKSEKASKYIDLLKGRPEINQNLHSSHQRFMDIIHTKLRHTNIYECNIAWGRKGLNPKLNRSHLYYTERLCSDFKRIVINHLSRIIKVSSMKCSPDVKRREASRNGIQEEILRHVRHGQALQRHCEFREAGLSDLRREVEISSPRPILLLGEAGWGKSTTMARAAHLASGWVPGDVKVLLRFVGLTGASRNVRLLLQSLCFQLAEMYTDHISMSEGLPQLASEFFSLLELVKEDSPVVMVLDGVDELSEEHDSDLSWLFLPLPPHVRLLLSASTDSPCAKLLQKSFQPTVIPLTPLSPKNIHEALERRLLSDGRRLQDWQWQILLQACLSCPSPLYLETAYAETRLWHSFTPPGGLSLPTDLLQLYHYVLSRLERVHGEQLVRRAAALISLSRNGITEEELLSLLPRDSQVMKEVELTHHPSIPPRVPYILWVSLRRDLGGHLTEVETDDTLVYRWTHAALMLVCKQKYLKTPEAQTSVHCDFAAYFLAGRSSNLDGKDGHMFQPLAWTLETGLVKSHVFNLRKLHGLPFHLIRSGQTAHLLSECLFSYEFLLHKVWGLSVFNVEEELKARIVLDKELPDVAALSQALQLSRTALLRDPCQLASQLLGRLCRIADDDRPVAPGDPRRFSYLHTLLSQCGYSSLPVLVPSFSCLLPPGGLQHTFLAGHLDTVTALTGARSGLLAVSCSRDGTLKTWDLKLGRAVSTLCGVGCHVDSMTLCMNDTMVVLTMKQTLQVLDIFSGQVLFTESDSLDIPVVTTTSDGQLLVAFYDGSHLMKVFDLADSCREICHVNITLERDAIHKDHTILVSHSSFKDYVLFAYRSGGEAAVLSARKGELLSTISAQHGAACVQGVELTTEYLLLFCRYPYKRNDKIIHIELFSMETFQYLRSIFGCSQDYISQLAVNRAGTHVVAFSQSWDTVTTEIITWNLETEDHKHIVRCSGLVTGGCCFDLRCCLGICNGEKYLRMWNLASRINDQSLTYNVHKMKSYGTAEVIPMTKYPRYVVCKSLRPGTVRVWNIVKPSCRSKPVRVEHGLYDRTDVTLVKGMKLYILTDRGNATFTDAPMPIFQMLLIYDLLKKSYIKKRSGLYVTPCPQQEFRLLEGELLLGLSETRDHLILWDLESVNSAGDALGQTYGNPLCKRRRLERKAQKEREEQRQLDREKHNSVDQYLLSGDEQVVVCSYFAHHLVVFSVASQDHLHTLEDRTSMLFLYTAAITHSGSHLVLSNYNDTQKVSYITLWDLHKGKVRKRLKNEPGVCCVAISSDANRVAFGVMGVNRLKVWDPFRKVHKAISGYESLNMCVSSQLLITEEGAKAILLAGEVSLWDLDAGTVLSVFTPDSRIQCLSLLGDNSTLLLGLSDSPTLVTMKLTSKEISRTSTSGDNLFGEQSSSSEDEGDDAPPPQNTRP